MRGTNKKLLLHFILLAGTMFFFGCASRNKRLTHLSDQDLENWVCVYSEHASPDEIRKFDLAVLDSDAHPDLSQLRNSRTILLGYISLAEVGQYRWFWTEISNQDWILDKNPNWDSWMVDVREQSWHDFVLDRIIPRILTDGFRGLFLDTIDTAEYLEKWHTGKKTPGAQDSMIKLIREIRRRYPKIYLVGNRGFSILNEIGPYLDGVVAESIFTNVDLTNDKMQLSSADQYDRRVRELKRARDKFHLMVFTLDYMNRSLAPEIQNIIAISRANGFVPFVSTPRLDTVYQDTLEP